MIFSHPKYTKSSVPELRNRIAQIVRLHRRSNTDTRPVRKRNKSIRGRAKVSMITILRNEYNY